MDLRHLRYFVATARDEHFGRASERLGLSQPAVSRVIADLEAELGVLMFNRVARGVRLTEAGRLYAAAAQRILADLDHANDMARRMGRGERGKLRLAYSGFAVWLPVMRDSIHRFRASYPEVEIRLVEMKSHMQREALLSDQIDAGFHLFWSQEDRVDFARFHLGACTLVVALHDRHRLAGRERLDVADLVDELFVGIRRELSPRLHQRMDSHFAAAGFRPAFVQFADDPISVLNFVSLGMGVALVHPQPSMLRPPGVLLKPVQGLEIPVEFDLVWRKADPSPVLTRFIEIVVKVAGSRV